MKKIFKSFMALAGAACIMLNVTSCTSWGQADPPAGNQVYPSREAFGPYSFKGLTATTDAPFLVSTEGTALIAYDPVLYTEVLLMNQGAATMGNPLTSVKLQTGAAVSMWVKADNESTLPLLTFTGADDGSFVSFAQDGKLTTSAPTTSVATTDGQLFTTDEWHFLAVQINNDGCIVYVDGAESAAVGYETDTALVSIINRAPYIKIGDVGHADIAVERIGVVRNTMNASDIKKPSVARVVTLPDPVYFNDFESPEDVTIVGAGSFTSNDVKGFGQVFQNVASTAPRQNYLLLPEHVLSHSAETQQMTIGFWVNAAQAGASATYNWAPLFTAYGAAPTGGVNDGPMFACQYRGLLQVNNNGWSDYTDAQNVDGRNHLYHAATSADWLEDGKWHYYTAVFDGENAKVYFDGELKNEWNMDGATNTQSGLFTNGSALKYICLGGNQAWNWADNDAGFAFDDFVVYQEALTEEQIEKIISTKGGGSVEPVEIPEYYYRNTFESADDRSLQIVGDGEFVRKSDKHGMIFQNVASTAPRQNYLLLPEDLLAHSAESQQLTVTFWVSAAEAGESESYMWAPLFTAYGAAPAGGVNTFPMFACQYRGVLTVNCAGFSDYTDAQNAAGYNTLYHGDLDWLADGKWHLYAVVLDGENAKVYFDGIPKNQWNMDGTTNTQKGVFTNGGDLKYICLGGNQAWDWNDNDAGFAFDDIMCFDTALTADQLKALYGLYQ